MIVINLLNNSIAKESVSISRKGKFVWPVVFLILLVLLTGLGFYFYKNSFSFSFLKSKSSFVESYKNNRYDSLTASEKISQQLFVHYQLIQSLLPHLEDKLVWSSLTIKMPYHFYLKGKFNIKTDHENLSRLAKLKLVKMNQAKRNLIGNGIYSFSLEGFLRKIEIKTQTRVFARSSKTYEIAQFEKLAKKHNTKIKGFDSKYQESQNKVLRQVYYAQLQFKTLKSLSLFFQELYLNNSNIGINESNIKFKDKIYFVDLDLDFYYHQ